MTRLSTRFMAFFLFLIVCGIAQVFTPSFLSAQENDPGIIRTLEIDSPQIENSYYLLASFDNDTSPRHWLYLYGEGLFALNQDWALEADFPNLTTQYPLGQVPVILSPIGLNLRYQFYHFGGWSSETAGAFSIEAGGAYAFPNTTFPWVGSSWSVNLLGGYRVGKFFIEGNYGYQGKIDPQVSNQWKANTGLGYHFSRDWYIQAEADLTVITSANNASWSFLPQIAFQPDDWLFELGESLNESPAGVTELMVARTF
ncbi:MAG TPA: hypothetical protein VK791_04585 [bacterium]|nr:hypothetical protein [bacterium]